MVLDAFIVQEFLLPFYCFIACLHPGDVHLVSCLFMKTITKYLTALFSFESTVCFFLLGHSTPL